MSDDLPVSPRTRRRVLRAVILALGGIAIAALLAAGHYQREQQRLLDEQDQHIRDRDAAWDVVKATRAAQRELERRSRAAFQAVTAQIGARDRRWTRALRQVGSRAAEEGRWAEAAVLLASALERQDDPELRFEVARALGHAVGPPVVAPLTSTVNASLRTISTRGDALAGVDRDGRVWWIHPRVSPTTVDARGGLTFLGDGSRLAVISRDGALTTLPQEGPPRPGPTLSGHSGGVTALAGASHAPLVATGDRAGTLRVWKLPAGTLAQTVRGAQGWILDLAWSDEGRLAVAGRDGTVQLLLAGAERTLRGHTRWARSLAFAPGGRVLAVGDGTGAIHLWEARQGVKLVVLRGHRGPVTGLGWRAGRLVSVAGDGVVLTWDVVATLSPAVELAGRAAQTGLRLDGLRAIAPSGGRAPGGSGR